jgi:hypothetical protein
MNRMDLNREVLAMVRSAWEAWSQTSASVRPHAAWLRKDEPHAWDTAYGSGPNLTHVCVEPEWVRHIANNWARSLREGREWRVAGWPA